MRELGTLLQAQSKGEMLVSALALLEVIELAWVINWTMAVQVLW